MTEYVEGYRPGYLGRIAEMHGVYYAVAWGSGFEFEGMMAEEIHAFLREYDPLRDLLLTAHVDGRLVGSFAIVGSREDPTVGRIRWVIVEEGYHGRGIGKELLRRGLEFCRQMGYTKVTLWTVEGLPQSYGLYEKAGFQVVERVPDARYSVPHVNLRMERSL
jgi:GNAT superfamily N-acetyltransferase